MIRFALTFLAPQSFVFQPKSCKQNYVWQHRRSVVSSRDCVEEFEGRVYDLLHSRLQIVEQRFREVEEHTVRIKSPLASAKTK